MKEALGVTGILLLFALVHSLFASGKAKEAAVRLFGAGRVRGLYRFAYTLLSILTTVAAAIGIGMIPDVTILVLPSPVTAFPRAAQAAVLLFAAAGFRVFSSSRFLGLGQVRDYLAGREIGGDAEGIETGALKKEGVYGIVRHPMYSAGFLFFLLSPAWTRTWIVVRLLAMGYFVFGAFVEDRRLLGRYGEEYRRYMKEVPRFLPRFLPAKPPNR